MNRTTSLRLGLLGGCLLALAVSGCALFRSDDTPPPPFDEAAARSLAHKDSCLRCHGELVESMVPGATTDPDAIRCVHCHLSVGHGEPVGLGGPDRGERAERGEP